MTLDDSMLVRIHRHGDAHAGLFSTGLTKQVSVSSCVSILCLRHYSILLTSLTLPDQSPEGLILIVPC